MEQKGFTLWFTGLPSSGKSAVADRVAEILKEKGFDMGDTPEQSVEA